MIDEKPRTEMLRKEEVNTEDKMTSSICLDDLERTFICYLKFEYKDVCTEYFQNDKPHCIMPCQLENCGTKTLYDMICPVWICEPFTPTTTISTTSTTSAEMTTTTENLPNSYKLKWQLSLAFNIFFLIISCAIFICVKRTFCNFCHRLRTNLRARFRRGWSTENENIPLQRTNPIVTFDSVLENHQSQLNAESFFSVGSDNGSEAGSPLSGFSEIMLGVPDSSSSDEPNNFPISFTTLTESITAADCSVSSQPKVSFLRKTLMRAAKKNRVQHVH